MLSDPERQCSNYVNFARMKGLAERRKIMKLMWRYVMRYKGWLVLDAICTLGFALAELGIPR